jgi:hypothetical protein
MSPTLAPNVALAQLSSSRISGAAMASLLPRQTIAAAAAPKRKRELVLEGAGGATQRSSFASTSTRLKKLARYKDDQTKHSTLPPPNKVKNQGSFPLPPLKESTTTTKRMMIPLSSYGSLWEQLQGEEQAFRKRLHNNKVPMEKDTSITGRYSKKG